MSCTALFEILDSVCVLQLLSKNVFTDKFLSTLWTTEMDTAWKVSKYEPEKTLNLDTFHTVEDIMLNSVF